MKQYLRKIKHQILPLLSLGVIVLSVVVVQTSLNNNLNPNSQAAEEDSSTGEKPTFNFSSNPDEVKYTGNVIVKFKSTPNQDTLVKTLSVGNKKTRGFEDLGDEKKLFKVTATTDEVNTLVAKYQSDPSVEYAEPDVYVPYLQAYPNDQYFSKQWWLVKIQAQGAWGINKGDPNVVVGMLDTGAQRNHPDLQSKIKYYAGAAECPNAQTAHGTHTTGIVGMATNNSIGGASIGNGISLAVYGAGGCGGAVSASTVATGVRWLTDSGHAKVINMSLGMPQRFKAMEDAINYAMSKDVVVVAAAGNDGRSTQYYPAALPGVLSVAATDSADRLARFSTHASWITVAAPGVAVFSTVQGSGYAAWDGTSMAAPVVSGLTGLVRSAFPSLNRQQVMDKICQTADKISGTGQNFQCGRVNAAKALTGGQGNGGGSTPTPSPGAADGNTIKLSFQGVNIKAENTTAQISIKKGYSNYLNEKVELTSDVNGIYTGKLSKSVTSGYYDIYVKGSSNLNKIFKNVSIQSGSTIDLSGKQTLELRAGDANSDNKININDVAVVSNYYTAFAVPVKESDSKMEAADINKDGKITIQDLALISINWSDIEVFGE